MSFTRPLPALQLSSCPALESGPLCLLSPCPHLATTSIISQTWRRSRWAKAVALALLPTQWMISGKSLTLSAPVLPRPSPREPSHETTSCRRKTSSHPFTALICREAGEMAEGEGREGTERVAGGQRRHTWLTTSKPKGSLRKGRKNQPGQHGGASRKAGLHSHAFPMLMVEECWPCS